MSKIKNNIHLYQSTLVNDSRILKETKSLVERNVAEKCFIVGIWQAGLNEFEKIDGKREVIRIKLLARSLPKNKVFRGLALVEWSVKAIIFFRKRDVDMVNCHGLVSLFIGSYFKIFKKSVLIYDAHELETEKIGMYGIGKIIAKICEKYLIKYVDEIIVVSKSIAEWYRDKYSLNEKKIHVVRNVPCKKNIAIQTDNLFRKKFNISPSDIIFLYVGILEKGRSIEMILRVFAELEKDKHVIFMGYGILKDQIKDYAKKYPNIHYHSAVKPSEVSLYAQSADVGLCVIEDVCLSYVYSLPNKLFEYICAKIPIIVSAFPEMEQVIDKYDCGWKTLPKEEAIKALVKGITKNEICKKKDNTIKSQNEYTWENEEKELIKAYSTLI